MPHEDRPLEELIGRGREPRRAWRRPWWSGFAAVIALLLCTASAVAIARHRTRVSPAASSAHEGSTVVNVGSSVGIVPVGGIDLSASGVAADPSTGRVYVVVRCLSGGDACRPARDVVRVIDASTRTVIASVVVGPGANAVAVDPLRNLVYVADAGVDVPASGANVAVIDGRTERVVKRVPVGTGLSDIAVEPRANLVFASASLRDELLTIDPVAGRVVRRTPVGGPQALVAASAGTGRVYVASAPVGGVPKGSTAFGSLLAIEGRTGRVVARTELPPLPSAIAVDEGTDRVYVGAEPNAIVTIDGLTGTVLRSVAIQRPVYGLAVSGETLVAVGGTDEGLIRVSLIDESTFAATRSVAFPGGAAVAIDPRAGLVYAIRADVLAIVNLS